MNWPRLPLHAAILAQDSAGFAELLAQGADPREQDEHGRDAIIVAALDGWADGWELIRAKGISLSASISMLALVSYWPRHPGSKSQDDFRRMGAMLLSEQPELELRDQRGRSALWLACYEGISDAALQLLQAGADPNSRDERGVSVLSTALNYGSRIYSDNLTVVQALLDAGARPRSAADDPQATPDALYWATSSGGRSAQLVSLLLAAGADPNDADPTTGNTALMNALHRADLLALLLDGGADIDRRNQQGKSALALAAEKGLIEAIELLLARGADPLLGDTMGRLPRDWARLQGHPDCEQRLQAHTPQGTARQASDYPLHLALHLGQVEEALRWADDLAQIHRADPDGNTPLHLAAEQGHLPVLDHLLSQHAALEARNHKGQTPLWLAVKAEQVAASLCLLQAGADPNAADEYGRMPLHLCGPHEDTTLAERLIEHGADLNSRYDLIGEETALSQAIHHHNLPMLRLLLQHGVDVRSSDTGAFSDGGPLNLAAAKAALPGEALDALIDAGAELHSRDFKGNTPLHQTVAHGSLEGMQRLLARGTSLELVNEEGSTAVMLAAMEGDQDKLALLLAHSAQVNVQNTNGASALHLAAFNLHVAIVAQLLKAGADPSLRCGEGRLPLDWAKSPFHRHEESQRQIYSLLA